MSTPNLPLFSHQAEAISEAPVLEFSLDAYQFVENDERGDVSYYALSGIPFSYRTGNAAQHAEKLGPSLEELFRHCHQRFTLKTILLIADQALYRIEWVHRHSYHLPNFGSGNFRMGLGTFAGLLHVVNVVLTETSESTSEGNLEASFIFVPMLTLSSIIQQRLMFAWIPTCSFCEA